MKSICLCFLKNIYYSSFEEGINLLTSISRIKRINESFPKQCFDLEIRGVTNSPTDFVILDMEMKN